MNPPERLRNDDECSHEHTRPGMHDAAATPTMGQTEASTADEQPMKIREVSQLTQPRDGGDAAGATNEPADDDLRCPLCQEHFFAAVTLAPCGHSFCSMCIRQHIHASLTQRICNKRRECAICRQLLPSTNAWEPNIDLQRRVSQYQQRQSRAQSVDAASSVVRPHVLPKVSFKLLKRNQLHKLLSDANLPTAPSEKECQRRYTQYSLYVQANWDEKVQPKTAAQLRKLVLEKSAASVKRSRTSRRTNQTNKQACAKRAKRGPFTSQQWSDLIQQAALRESQDEQQRPASSRFWMVLRIADIVSSSQPSKSRVHSLCRFVQRARIKEEAEEQHLRQVGMSGGDAADTDTVANAMPQSIRSLLLEYEAVAGDDGNDSDDKPCLEQHHSQSGPNQSTTTKLNKATSTQPAGAPHQIDGRDQDGAIHARVATGAPASPTVTTMSAQHGGLASSANPYIKHRTMSTSQANSNSVFVAASPAKSLASPPRVARHHIRMSPATSGTPQKLVNPYLNNKTKRSGAGRSHFAPVTQMSSLSMPVRTSVHPCANNHKRISPNTTVAEPHLMINNVRRSQKRKGPQLSMSTFQKPPHSIEMTSAAFHTSQTPAAPLSIATAEERVMHPITIDMDDVISDHALMPRTGEVVIVPDAGLHTSSDGVMSRETSPSRPKKRRNRSQKPPFGWSCSICTFTHRYRQPNCAMCGAPSS